MKMLLPSTVTMKCERRGTVCKFVYAETMDPRHVRMNGKLVGKRKLVVALANTLIVMKQMMADIPHLRGLKVTCPTPLSVRISGTAHTHDFGLFMSSEFKGWHDESWKEMAAYVAQNTLDRTLDPEADS